MTSEIHLTRKDFTVQWFSGTGKGGQNRNKRQNCCRIVHKASGLVAVGQRHRDRVANQREAFERLAVKVIEWYTDPEDRVISEEVVRNYHEPRNEVLDKASGLRQPYRQVVIDAELGDMIEARAKAVRG